MASCRGCCRPPAEVSSRLVESSSALCSGGRRCWWCVDLAPAPQIKGLGASYVAGFGDRRAFLAGRGGGGGSLPVVSAFLLLVPGLPWRRGGTRAPQCLPLRVTRVGAVLFLCVVVSYSGSRWRLGGGSACWWWSSYGVCSI
jgi:hypothetical protein